MQAPGGPEEDSSGGFKYGGWSMPLFDDAVGQAMGEQMGHPFDLLLGRKTYDIFAGFWPKATDPTGDAINRATKYVVTHRPVSTDWKKTVPSTAMSSARSRSSSKKTAPSSRCTEAAT